MAIVWRLFHSQHLAEAQLYQAGSSEKVASAFNHSFGPAQFHAID